MDKHHRVWSLQEAKAKFSEVVRLAQSEGPQTVTVHGKEVVTITKTTTRPEEAQIRTGLDLVRALQSCPHPEVFEEIDRLRVREPVILKDVDLD